MGMIQTIIKAVPESKTPAQFYTEVNNRMPDFAEGSEGYELKWLKPDEFDSAWKEQENIKDTPEIEAKYRKLTSEGKVLCVEIDW